MTRFALRHGTTVRATTRPICAETFAAAIAAPAEIGTELLDTETGLVLAVRTKPFAFLDDTTPDGLWVLSLSGAAVAKSDETFIPVDPPTGTDLTD